MSERSAGEDGAAPEGPVKEVVDMATQKVKPPEPDIREWEGPGQKRRRTYGSIATYALVAFVLFVVAAAALAVARTDRTADAVQPGSPATDQTGTAPDPEPSADLSGVPEGPNRFRPMGSEPAAPEPGSHGKVVMSEVGDLHAVFVFADGRVIFQRVSSGGPWFTHGWIVRRLTPTGIDLVRQGVIVDLPELPKHKYLDPFGLPVSAWRDPKPQPYQASRHAVCPSGFHVPTDWRQLPPQARDLLQGSEEGYIDRCVVVTHEDALRLDQIFSRTDGIVGRYTSKDSRYTKTGSWSGSIRVYPILPNAGLVLR